jgi:AcrR family transcriptional regulator
MDARIAKTHRAVMEAAADLLMEEGPAGLTVDGVVARSGVAKSTVYRHWATRDDLVAAVFQNCAPDLDPPPADLAFEPALRAMAASFVELLNDEHWKRLLPALVLLKSQKGDIARLENDLQEQQSDVMAEVLQRGVDEGVLDPAVLDDLHRTVTLLVGPFLMAGVFDSVLLDQSFADAAVDQFLAANGLPARLDAPA